MSGPKDFSDLIDEIKKYQYREPECVIRTSLARMDDQMRGAVSQALEDRSITGAAISKYLEAKDYPVSTNTIYRCREKCRCDIVAPPRVFDEPNVR